MSADRPMVALCVGHSRLVNGRVEGGAVSVGGCSEHSYWSGTVQIIATALAAGGIASAIIDRYQGEGYGAAMRCLAGRVRELKAACAVELHFNDSDNPRACGHEWLYWHASERSKALADALETSLAYGVRDLTARGLKPITAADRGAEFLRLTHCPAVIAEPFFGSNSGDWKTAVDRQNKIACAIASGIANWLAKCP
jgi:N-acetylmuramoyl-L-alanine amidase